MPKAVRVEAAEAGWFARIGVGVMETAAFVLPPVEVAAGVKYADTDRGDDSTTEHLLDRSSFYRAFFAGASALSQDSAAVAELQLKISSDPKYARVTSRYVHVEIGCEYGACETQIIFRQPDKSPNHIWIGQDSPTTQVVYLHGPAALELSRIVDGTADAIECERNYSRCSIRLGKATID
jgi:hypothetical protein